MTIFDYMRLVDQEYGSEAHQRAFLARMDRAQSLHPCRVDHVVVGDKPPIHVTRCYPVDAKGRMVGL